MNLIHTIQRKLVKLRMQPIRVYCLHHVSATFDEESMIACDWMRIEDFKKRVIRMHNSGIKFISLTEAYRKITNDKFRKAKYVVLTFDDGYASLKEILPWLEAQHIPATLFINGKYLDGKSYRISPNERYLTKDELLALSTPLIEIGSHGWEHTKATELTESEFAESIDQNIHLLSSHPRYIPFHAYTWGVHDATSDTILNVQHIVPVLIDGTKNYKDKLYIHRELLK